MQKYEYISSYFVDVYEELHSNGFYISLLFPPQLVNKKITVINWDWKLKVTTWLSTFCLGVVLYKYSSFHYRQSKNNGNPFIVWFWTQILFDFRSYLLFCKASFSAGVYLGWLHCGCLFLLYNVKLSCQSNRLTMFDFNSLTIAIMYFKWV